MNKTFCILLFAAMMGTVSVCWAQTVQFQESYQKALTIAQSESKYIMIEFSTDWSELARRFRKEIYASPRTCEMLAADFVLVRLNPEKNWRDKELARRWGVRDYPHIVFLDMREQRLDEMRGYISVYRFNTILENLGKRRRKMLHEAGILP